MELVLFWKWAQCVSHEKKHSNTVNCNTVSHIELLHFQTLDEEDEAEDASLQYHGCKSMSEPLERKIDALIFKSFPQTTPSLNKRTELALFVYFRLCIRSYKLFILQVLQFISRMFQSSLGFVNV